MRKSRKEKFVTKRPLPANALIIKVTSAADLLSLLKGQNYAKHRSERRKIISKAAKGH
jgi:hypothetical protein